MILSDTAISNIPKELREMPHWVCFRLDDITDPATGQPKIDPLTGCVKKNKVPIRLNGENASSTNPKQWTSFEKACAAAVNLDGIGFQLGFSGYAGIDLDHCIIDGVLEDWAKTVIDSFSSYTEYSVSRTGVHILVKGQVKKGRKHGNFEAYSSARYFTMSGAPFPGSNLAIESRQDELTTFVKRVFPPDTPPTARQSSSIPSTFSDGDLLTKARGAKNGAAFERLWDGDTSGHQNDASRADLALCCHLAFWFGNNASAIDRVFRSSGLMRDKWAQREDYRENTIAKACAATLETFSPPGVKITQRPKSLNNGQKPNGAPFIAASPASPSDEWDLPVPFGLNNLPAFPLEALPSPLLEFVAEVAASTQVPVDMAAMMGLGVVATAGARRGRVQIGKTHSEPLSLYIAAVMEPGSRKSSTLEAFAEPIREAERMLTIERMGAHLTAKEKKEQETKRLGYLRDRAAKENAEVERRVLEDEAQHLAANMTEVPELPRLLADDVTMERLAGLLSEQEDNCIGILSAEGGLFGILAGRYASGAINLDLVLKGHSGETHRVDRQNQPVRYIQCPTITMALAVQPDVLNSLADNAAFRGRGLLGRFLYALPENLVGSREYQNRPINAEAKEHYEDMIRTLLNLPSPVTKDDPSRRHILKLDGAALDLWKQFHDDVERRQADGGDLAGIRDWASKLSGGVARIAGNLHLVEHHKDLAPWNTPISVETVAAAWSIGQFCIPHALAAFNEMGADATHAIARRVLKWIEKSKPETFSVRDCFRVHQNSAKMEELEGAIAILCNHGYIRLEEQERSGPGRKPSPLYAVNPSMRKPEGK